MPAMTALFRQNPMKVVPVYQRSLKMTIFAVGALMIIVTLASPAISLIWTGDFVREYSILVAIMAVGVLLNAVGAPAYNLATVTGNMRNNILTNVTVLAILIVGGLATALLLPVYGLICMIAVAMGMGGVLIKIQNERFLPSTS
jgi:O-antigen/teichoic acid export membrane protein